MDENGQLEARSLAIGNLNSSLSEESPERSRNSNVEQYT